MWRAVETAWHTGAALAGCSAGAIALTDHVPDLRHPLRPAEVGLGAVPTLRVLPHFDRFAGRLPRRAADPRRRHAPGVTVVGIDEDTALVSVDGEPGRWEVVGRLSVWVLTSDGRTERPTGSTPLA